MIGNIDIYETVSSCCYPNTTRDYIGKNILDLYKANSSTKFFKVVKDNDKIMVASFKINVIYKSKTYFVPVLIYFPKDFPKSPPDIYLESKDNQGINPKNKDIDPKTKKMSLGTLRAWNIHSTIQGIIKDIEISFQKEFPIYQLSNEIGKSSVNKGDFSNILNLEECFSQYNNNINNNNNKNNNNNWNNTSNFNNNINKNNNNNWNSSNSNINWNNNNNSNWTNNSNWNNNNNNNSNWSNNNSNWNNNNINNLSDKNEDYQPGYDKLVNNVVDFNNTSKIPTYNNPGNLDINNNLNTSKYSWNNENKNSYYDINQNNINNINYNNNNYQNNNFQTSKFDQKSNNNSNDYSLEIKKKLIEEINRSVQIKLQETSRNITSDMEKLNHIKNDMLIFKDKYNQFQIFKNKSSERYINKLSMIDQETYELKAKILELKQMSMTENNYHNFIVKKSPYLLRSVSMQATVEDLLIVIENAYNKGTLDFNESLNLYRSVAKEMVKLKYYSKKLSN